jgi:hypothetical protein
MRNRAVITNQTYYDVIRTPPNYTTKIKQCNVIQHDTACHSSKSFKI